MWPGISLRTDPLASRVRPYEDTHRAGVTRNMGVTVRETHLLSCRSGMSMRQERDVGCDTQGHRRSRLVLPQPRERFLLKCCALGTSLALTLIRP